MISPRSGQQHKAWGGANRSPRIRDAKQVGVLKQVLGKQIRLGGEEHSGWLPSKAALPRATKVENALVDVRILEIEGGFILEWESRNTDHGSDTWHETIEEAEDQAEHQFGIQASDWQVPDGRV